MKSRYFNQQERVAFELADEKEWRSFLETGAIEIIQPSEAEKVPKERICSRPMRNILTNKNKAEHGKLEAKTRLVTPGDVDPDGEIPVEDGCFRTDAPTCPQLAFHLLCSYTVRQKKKTRYFRL